MNRKGTGYIVSNLVKAEQSGNAKAVQEAYEELFTFCYQNGLDLNVVLAETEQRLKREAPGVERSSRRGGFWAFVVRHWPLVPMKLRLHLPLFSPIFVVVFAGLLLSAPLAGARRQGAAAGQPLRGWDIGVASKPQVKTWGYSRSVPSGPRAGNRFEGGPLAIP
jgi:hypothetical protein